MGLRVGPDGKRERGFWAEKERGSDYDYDYDYDYD
jgi:hypothetical protein